MLIISEWTWPTRCPFCCTGSWTHYIINFLIFVFFPVSRSALIFVSMCYALLAATFMSSLLMVQFHNITHNWTSRELRMVRRNPEYREIMVELDEGFCQNWFKFLIMQRSEWLVVEQSAQNVWGLFFATCICVTQYNKRYILSSTLQLSARHLASSLWNTRWRHGRCRGETRYT